MSGQDSPEPKPNDRDAFYLSHMLECIEDIGRYCTNNDIASDQRTLDAVLRKLQILTESSTRVSTELKAAYTHVTWRELAGFRNVVVHDYFDISVERIGRIVREDIPKLKDQILAILAAIGGRGDG